jgi:hypothetical protein
MYLSLSLFTKLCTVFVDNFLSCFYAGDEARDKFICAVLSILMYLYIHCKIRALRLRFARSMTYISGKNILRDSLAQIGTTSYSCGCRI